MVNAEVWKALVAELDTKKVRLVAVSKTKPVSDIAALYQLGQRDFAENYVQELLEKQPQLPADVRWHFTGHLQSNKVKQIASFIHLIHAVDSFKLLQEIDKQGRNHNRVIDVLLQMHIADEETKFGMDEKEVIETLDRLEANPGMNHVRICGLMGMATNSDDDRKVKREFARLYAVYKNLSQSYFIKKEYFIILSMGMSGDYKLAVEEGSTMVRIGSLLFGER